MISMSACAIRTSHSSKFRRLCRAVVLLTIGAFCSAAISACTHLMQTDAGDLPGRVERGGFSFERPDRIGWYMQDTVDPPTLFEMTRHDGRNETQILVLGVAAPSRIGSIDDLDEWCEDLPDGDKVISAAPDHGALCLRYHGRSTFAVHYADAAAPAAYVVITDEDTLECVDPRDPKYVVRFIYAQHGPSGGTAAGASEADAFIKSIQYQH